MSNHGWTRIDTDENREAIAAAKTAERWRERLSVRGSGGLSGYYRLLDILAEPENPEHEEMKEWVGGDFKPEVFDCEEANARLKQLKF